MIDTVEYDDVAPWPAEPDGSGESLELIDPNLDNSAAASWAPGQLYTPGRVNAPDVSGVGGDVVFTEIMYASEMRRYVQPIDPIANPRQWRDGDDPAGEYLDLLNRSAATIDLSGWRILDGGGIVYQFDAGASLGAGQYLVVASNSQHIQARYAITNVVGNFAVGRELSDNGEPLTLTNAAGRIVDFVHYGDNSPWPIGPDQLSVSLELLDPMADNRNPANWRSSRVPRPSIPIQLFTTMR
jgi:hypothetical protein